MSNDPQELSEAGIAEPAGANDMPADDIKAKEPDLAQDANDASDVNMKQSDPTEQQKVGAPAVDSARPSFDKQDDANTNCGMQPSDLQGKYDITAVDSARPSFDEQEDDENASNRNLTSDMQDKVDVPAVDSARASPDGQDNSADVRSGMVSYRLLDAKQEREVQNVAQAQFVSNGTNGSKLSPTPAFTQSNKPLSAEARPTLSADVSGHPSCANRYCACHVRAKGDVDNVTSTGGEYPSIEHADLEQMMIACVARMKGLSCTAVDYPHMDTEGLRAVWNCLQNMLDVYERFVASQLQAAWSRTHCEILQLEEDWAAYADNEEEHESARRVAVLALKKMRSQSVPTACGVTKPDVVMKKTQEEAVDGAVAATGQKRSARDFTPLPVRGKKQFEMSTATVHVTSAQNGQKKKPFFAPYPVPPTVIPKKTVWPLSSAPIWTNGDGSESTGKFQNSEDIVVGAGILERAGKTYSNYGVEGDGSDITITRL